MPARQKPDAPAATSTMNKCVRAATIRYEITPSAGNGPLERQFCPSTEFAGEPWKARTGYSQRWVEGVFSMFKRMFGEHVTALKWENILQEIRLKVALYNRWRDESIARELGEGAMQMA